ncbi:MAG: bifunctional metallophosphatase/5'-nucleotidase, partial [Nitriliruptorales bacterium]|nr:bifunctional metallophosphatase/5'-nucleotidase [Nitriliruptorales bacterium]
MHSTVSVWTPRAVGTALLALLLTLGTALPGHAAKPSGETSAVEYTLTLLHNNDGESKLMPDADGNGGLARFATLVDQQRTAAVSGRPEFSGRRGVVLVSSGDNFLAGPEWNASLEKGVPFYDSIGLDHIGYDAMTIGNHEFDFGPDVLADFIAGFSPDVPFISANLDVSANDALAKLATMGQLTGSTVVSQRGRRIGIVGATTPRLPDISSPGDVVVNAVLPAVQAEVDRLTAQGVSIIILSSHLQDIDEELALVPQLRDVDIVIAGGGDENLGEDYPLSVTDAEGEDTFVVTTPGDYHWLGKLVVGFDRDGEPLTAADSSGLLPVTAELEPDPFIQANVVDPVQEYTAELAARVVADSEVPLNGLRGAVAS